MGWLSTLGNLGVGLGSLIPGAGPFIGAIGGGLMNGLAQSGGNTTTGKSNSAMTGNKTTNSTGTIDQTNEAIEDPEFANFRESLIPMMHGLLNKASQPVYTDSKIASTLAGINNQYSKEDINPAMAGRGLLGSGFNQQMRQDVDNQRSGTASNFFAQLPFLEQQAQLTNMGNALGMATGWAGRAPVGQKITGTNTNTGNETFGQNTNNTFSQTVPKGSGFLSGFADSLGGFLGSKSGSNWLGGLGKKGGGGGGGDLSGFGQEW